MSQSELPQNLLPRSVLTFVLKRIPIIVGVEKGKGAKASSSKQVSYSKREAKQFSVLTPFDAARKRL